MDHIDFDELNDSDFTELEINPDYIRFSPNDSPLDISINGQIDDNNLPQALTDLKDQNNLINEIIKPFYFNEQQFIDLKKENDTLFRDFLKKNQDFKTEMERSAIRISVVACATKFDVKSPDFNEHVHQFYSELRNHYKSIKCDTDDINIHVNQISEILDKI